MAGYKGRYSVKNPQKYKGDPTKVTYRSLLERRVMVWLDKNPSVQEWSSEETIIQYISPLDNRTHRYFVDFAMKYINRNNEIKNILIEVKPEKQTKEPKMSKNRTRRYINEVATWLVNDAKWKFARAWCEQNGYEFQIWTEKHIDVVSPRSKKPSKKLNK